MKLLLALFVLYVALLALACATCSRGTGVNGEESRRPSKDAHDVSHFHWRGVPAPVPHPRPTAASRSRTAAGRSGTGRPLDVTCYVATGQRTASGLWPRPGMAASNRWPFGTRLRIEHVGAVVVQDRIGHGSDLDLFMTSRAACVRFGRQQLHVEVLP